ncbi:hypothetical protein BDQ94DRAFT_135723 [Aspergillus welwitschiae]|uniref:Uncharacterized protein n=1 Tax=Aspergillus welwitschiae TaxID=1341132 RepID=A0A3F3QGA2_9EURO|nr:hypothetical protein BDQ94DRAFT_135723 [Aspergillus welwitschiae]RDH38135.1 hypothetical protein BDQ94DRAFT_135723 [Aspergillus welwitschiae]
MLSTSVASRSALSRNLRGLVKWSRQSCWTSSSLSCLLHVNSTIPVPEGSLYRDLEL